MRTLSSKLTRKQQDELFVKLTSAISLLKDSAEGAQFLKDLLSGHEVVMLARRLQVAELLLEGATYREINDQLKVGLNTIAKIQTWLTLYGDGYRSVISKMAKHKRAETDYRQRPFDKLKRQYPMYFWPQLLLEEIVQSADRRQKQKLCRIVGQLREKDQLSRQLTKLLEL